LELRLQSEVSKQQDLHSEMVAMKEQQDRRMRVHKLQLLRLQEHIETQEKEIAEMRDQMSHRSSDSIVEVRALKQHRNRADSWSSSAGPEKPPRPPRSPRLARGKTAAPSPSAVAEAFAEGRTKRLKKSRSPTPDDGMDRVQNGEPRIKQHLGRKESSLTEQQDATTASTASMSETAQTARALHGDASRLQVSPSASPDAYLLFHEDQYSNELRSEADEAWARVRKLEAEHAVLCEEINSLHGVIDDVRVAWRSRAPSSAGLPAWLRDSSLPPTSPELAMEAEKTPPQHSSLAQSMERESFGVLL